MANRLLNIVACILVGVVAIGLGIIFWNQTRQPNANEAAATIAEASGPAKTPAPAEAASKPAFEPAAAPAQKTLATWPEVEAQFAKLREERKMRPYALFDLEKLYAAAFEPQFTHTADYPEHCERLAVWRREFPASPTALVALAGAHIRWAWKARGSGFGYTVSEEGWQLFHTRIAEGRRLLEKAQEMGPPDGETAAELVIVAKSEGLPLDQTRQWLDAGMKLDPGYQKMYREMAQYLLPRWHGEPGDIERFAAEMVQKLPGDDGLDTYGQIAFAVNSYDPFENRLVFRGQFDRGLLAKAAKTLARRYAEGDRLMEFAALCAMASGDQAAARLVRQHIGDFDASPSRILPDSTSYRGFIAWCQGPDEHGGYLRRVWGGHSPSGLLQFAPDGRNVWCGLLTGNTAAYLLDTEQGRAAASLAGVRGTTIDALAIDDERQWAVGAVHSADGEHLTLWNLNRPGIPALIPISEKCVLTKIHPHTMQVAWASERRVHLLNVETGAEGAVLEVTPLVREMSFSPDGKWLMINHAGTTVWDVAASKQVAALPRLGLRPEPPLACQRALCCDDAGQVWAVGSAQGNPGRKLCLVRFAADGKTGEVLVPDLQAQGPILEETATLSPDGKWVAAALPVAEGTGRIRVFDIGAGRVLRDLPGHYGQASILRFSPDSKLLASMGAFGGEIRIWSVEADKN